MSTKKTVTLMLLAVVFGYGFHDLLDDKGIKPLFRTINIPKQITQSVLGQTTGSDFITSVTYDGTAFHPDHITVQKGNYLAITNKSHTELMWLESPNKELSTVRGYGEGERLQAQLTHEGSFFVRNRLNIHATIDVTVIP